MRFFQISMLLVVFLLNNWAIAQEKEVLSLDESISLYPNPVTEGVLNIEFLDDNEGSLTVYDFLGNEMLEVELDIPAAHKYKFYVSDLSAGKYFVRLSIQNKVITKKISIL